MSESERRRKYRYDRVLIETARVLSSTFDDAVVYLSGVQLEMLRNVTQYLRRLETYVTEYNPGYYLTPTIADYDDILAIVADLEETLMGNPNTIWGYKEVYKELKFNDSIGAGEQTLYGTVVPAGEVWWVQNVSCVTDSLSCTSLRIVAYLGATHIPISEVIAPVADNLYPFALDVVLSEGDRLYCRFYDLTLNDDVGFYITGYKMDVP